MGIIEKIKTNIPLAPLTSFKIGGPAKYFIKVKSREELKQAIRWARDKKIKKFILGQGTNVLINDYGVNGLVILLAFKAIQKQGSLIKAEAGALLSSLVDFALKSSLAGMEWAVGIPGTVGGAVRGNAGAYGCSIFDHINKVEVFDSRQEKIFMLPAKECAVGYRETIFKKDDNLIVLSAFLNLKEGKVKAIKKAMERIRKLRQAKLPLWPSAGSIFKNLPEKDLAENNPNLLVKAKKSGVVKNGKVPAGWIINQADLELRQVGQAKLSEEHANIIINMGEAKAEEVITLISVIKMKIRNQFHLELKEEIEYFGF